MENSHELNIKNRFKRIIPLTGRGMLFIVFSPIIFVIGIVRTDLAALFWSSTFLLLLLYTFIGSHIIYYLIKKKLSVNTLDFKLSDKYIFPGDTIEAFLKIELPQIFIPGFSTTFNVKLIWPPRSPLVFQHPLQSGNNEICIKTKVKKRGYYKTVECELDFLDNLGFTKSVLKINLKESVYIFPNTSEAIIINANSQGEPAMDFQIHTKKSNELYEVRKYYPGDDTRKINWKLYAHLGEFFIKSGEDTPPPKSNVLFILDTSKSLFIPNIISENYLDSLIEYASSALLDFLKTNSSVSLLLPDQNHVLNFTSEDKIKLQRLLAGCKWSNNENIQNLNNSEHTNIIVFTSPHSIAQKNILTKIKHKKSKVRLIIKKINFPFVKKENILNQIFFFNEHKKQQYIHKSIIMSINKKITAQVTVFKSSPWNLEYVNII